LSLTVNDDVDILYIASASATDIVTIQIKNVAGSYRIRLYAVDDEDVWDKFADATNLTVGSHWIEGFIQRETRDGSNDGVISLWIDDVLQGTNTTLDNYTRFGQYPKYWNFGFIGTNTFTTTSGTLYLDEFQANNDGSYIGPIPNFSATDTLTIGETTAIDMTRALSVTDALTVGEVASVQGGTNVNVSDNLTVGETVTVEMARALSVTDNLTIGETVSVQGGARPNVTDSLTVGETITLALGAINATEVNVTDSLTIGETVTVQAGANVSVTDNLTIGESAITTADVQPVTVDNLVVGEVITVTISSVSDLAIVVTDNIILGEIVVARTGDLNVIATDTLIIGEVYTVQSIFIIGLLSLSWASRQPGATFTHIQPFIIFTEET
jgi:acetyltransferase-like isoleucine patch superfamily enzyme